MAGLSSSTGKTQQTAHEEATVSPFKTMGESIRRTSKPVPPKNKATQQTTTDSGSHPQNSHQKLLASRRPSLLKKDGPPFARPGSGRPNADLDSDMNPGSARLSDHTPDTIGLKDGLTDLPSSIFKGATALGYKASSKADPILENDIKQIRIQLVNTLQSISLISLREIDQIKKPQKYMFFAVLLFKALFELVEQIHNLILQFGSKSKKRKLKMSANDLNQDLDSCNDTRQNETERSDDEQLDQQLKKAIQQKYFIQAETELRRLSLLQTSDMSQQKIQLLDLEIQTLWVQELKPFVCQNTQLFQTRINSMGKFLKKLIEENTDSITDLKLIHDFALKLLELLRVHAFHVSNCQKQIKSGSVFGKLIMAIKYSALYSQKKCQKEMERVRMALPEPAAEMDAMPPASGNVHAALTIEKRASAVLYKDEKDMIDIQVNSQVAASSLRRQHTVEMADPDPITPLLIKHGSQGMQSNNRVFTYEPSTYTQVTRPAAPHEFRIELKPVEVLSSATPREYPSRRSSRRSLHSLHSHELIEEDEPRAPREEVKAEKISSAVSAEHTPKQALEQNLKEKEDGVVMLQGEQEAIQESIFNFEHDDYECLETSHNSNAGSNPGPEVDLREATEHPQSEAEPIGDLIEPESLAKPR